MISNFFIIQTTLADEFLNDFGEDFEIDDLKQNNVKDVTKLVHTMEYIDFMDKIHFYNDDSNTTSNETYSVVEEHPEYELITKCNEMTSEMDSEIVNIHRFLRDKYNKRCPELEQLIIQPLDYARCVKRLGNKLEVKSSEFAGILPSSNIISLSVTVATTRGKPLTDEELSIVLEACDVMLKIDEDKQLILSYIEKRMNFFAPNLSYLVGTHIASKLISAAGGLSSLAKIPSCNLYVIGAKKRGTLDGFSAKTTVVHAGYVFETDLVQRCPKDFQQRAAKLVAGKCSLAARVDTFHTSPDGEVGKKLFDECMAKIDKWLEPDPGRKEKALPLPIEAPKKRRGGRKYLKMKQRYSMTELRKKANRIAFGEESEEYGSEYDLGLLKSKEGSGLIRISANYDNKGFKIKAPKQKIKGRKASGNATQGSATSVFAITHDQALEFENPFKNLKDADEGYFSTVQGFTSTINNKK